MFVCIGTGRRSWRLPAPGHGRPAQPTATTAAAPRRGAAGDAARPLPQLHPGHPDAGTARHPAHHGAGRPQHVSGRHGSHDAAGPAAADGQVRDGGGRRGGLEGDAGRHPRRHVPEHGAAPPATDPSSVSRPAPPGRPEYDPGSGHGTASGTGSSYKGTIMCKLLYSRRLLISVRILSSARHDRKTFFKDLAAVCHSYWIYFSFIQ